MNLPMLMAIGPNGKESNEPFGASHESCPRRPLFAVRRRLRALFVKGSGRATAAGRVACAVKNQSWTGGADARGNPPGTHEGSAPGRDLLARPADGPRRKGEVVVFGIAVGGSRLLQGKGLPCRSSGLATLARRTGRRNLSAS